AFFGLPLVADIVEEAMQIHVHRAPRLDGARDQGTIEAFMKTYQDDPFRSVSERYLALSDEIRSARIRHIRAHPELFVHPTGGTAVATIVFFRGNQWTQGRARIALTLGLALVSRACLDALSTYSVGVEFFAPFSQQRFRFPWTPLGPPSGGVLGQLAQEAVVI